MAELLKDSKGRFLPKNGGGGARPGAGQKPLVEREMLDKAVSPAQWLTIFERLRDNAIGGCVKSTSLLLDRRFGKVKDAVEEGTVNAPPVTINIAAPTYPSQTPDEAE